MRLCPSISLLERKLNLIAEYAHRKQAFKEYMNDDTAEAIGMHANVDAIKEEASKEAEKSAERLRDIDAMIEFLKGDSASKEA